MLGKYLLLLGSQGGIGINARSPGLGDVVYLMDFGVEVFALALAENLHFACVYILLPQGRCQAMLSKVAKVGGRRLFERKTSEKYAYQELIHLNLLEVKRHI